MERRLDLPALGFMTDFEVVSPISVKPDIPIDTALHKMRDEGIRLLMVTDTDGTIVGKITAMEIQGQKPIEIAQERRVRRDEIRVKDVMTPQAEVRVVNLMTVRNVQIGHVVATLNQLKLQHLLVVEVDSASGAQVVRGVFSRTQISKSLQMDISQIQAPADSLAAMMRDVDS
jgi:CBS-domain-containing membrane protein